MESGQRDVGGILTRAQRGGATRAGTVTPHLQCGGGRRAGAGRRGHQPIAALRRAAAGACLAVSQARRRGRHVRGVTVKGTSAVEVYYDPYDFAIDDDPYPTWKRLRDEAPVYYNEKYN